ncbi:MAG: Trk system potassium transporter TrkA [Rhodospirillaceae bacterium]|nr:Trk system potassium transporter TrkA [Rhodospirillaceae bacterium]
MQVIVCGAGQVGLNIARHLATENNEVTVVDRSEALVRKISDALDVRGIVGHASHPDVLERAGARDCEMIIAVTQVDEVNMVACQVAHSLFRVPIKIARVRAQSYLQRDWAGMFSADHMPIDFRISPEIEVARAVRRRMHVPGAFDVISLGQGQVQVIGTRLGNNCPILDTPLRQLSALFPDLATVIVSIIRDGKTIVPKPDDQLLVGDEIYFVADVDHVSRAMAAFGHEEPEAHRVIIVGGGNIGLFLAQEIEEQDEDVTVKLIEIDENRAKVVATSLAHTMVVHGDVLESEILDELNLAHTDMMITVTNDDEVNVLAALMAKRLGCERTVALVNTIHYQPLVTSLGVDVAVSPRAITVSTILQHLRRGRIRAVHSLRDGVGEIIEAKAMDTSSIVGKPLSLMKLDKGIMIGAIIRDETVHMPRGDTVIEAGDRVILYALPSVVRKVDKLFSVSLEFF